MYCQLCNHHLPKNVCKHKTSRRYAAQVSGGIGERTGDILETLRDYRRERLPIDNVSPFTHLCKRKGNESGGESCTLPVEQGQCLL